MPLAVGTKAPDFTLPTKTSDGPKQVTLSENFGKRNTLLAFFPMAFTSTCTTEMCGISSDLSAYAEMNAAARIRYVTAERDPLVVGYDEAEWARRFDYHRHPLEHALATVEAVRANTVALLRRLPEEEPRRRLHEPELGAHDRRGDRIVLGDHLGGSPPNRVKNPLVHWRFAS